MIFIIFKNLPIKFVSIYYYLEIARYRGSYNISFISMSYLTAKNMKKDIILI